MKLLLTFLALAALALGDHGHSQKQPPPPPSVSTSTVPYSVPMDPSIWLIEHRDDPSSVAKLVNGTLQFPIQSYNGAPDNGNWNNYVDWEPWLNGQSKGKTKTVTSINMSKAKTLIVVVRIQTTGQPTWRYDSAPDNTCITPAHLRPYIAVGENNSHFNDTGRWWSNSTQPGTNFQLDTLPPNADITLTLVMDLTDPAQWSDVNGESGNLNANTISQFAVTKTALGEMGFTLGGGCFFGHGVAVVGGTATMTLIQYRFD